MHWSGRDRPLCARVVLIGTHGLHSIGVTIAQLEDLDSYIGPGDNLSGSGEVVSAIFARSARLEVPFAITEQPEDTLGHVAREGEASKLVIHHRHLSQRVIKVGTAV